MTTRTYTQKNGTVWEWEETPELARMIYENLDPNKTLAEFVQEDNQILDS